MIQNWKEKRRYPRFKVNCPVSFICFDKLKIGETQDLSLGGMKIRSRAMLFKGETYDFTVVMNGHTISPRGRIVYIETRPEFTYGAGISFLHLSEDHQTHLDGFLSAKES